MRADLAAELLITSSLVKGFDPAQVAEIVGHIATLQVNALSNASFAFDKTASSFDNVHDYRKALHAYNKAAYTKFKAEFNGHLAAIVKEMNAAMPAEARKANR